MKRERGRGTHVKVEVGKLVLPVEQFVFEGAVAPGDLALPARGLEAHPLEVEGAEVLSTTTLTGLLEDVAVQLGDDVAGEAWRRDKNGEEEEERRKRMKRREGPERKWRPSTFCVMTKETLPAFQSAYMARWVGLGSTVSQATSFSAA